MRPAPRRLGRTPDGLRESALAAPFRRRHAAMPSGSPIGVGRDGAWPRRLCAPRYPSPRPVFPFRNRIINGWHSCELCAAESVPMP